MARVINNSTPGKRRNYHMRSCAELLRRLSQKEAMDDESRDMLAALVMSLRAIDDTIDEAITAWEKRDYWIKAEEFRERWRWAGNIADELTNLVLQENWQSLPGMMARLFPNFADIKINTYTRKETLWKGCYERFISENA
jgi:hypothetical protein